MYRKNVSGQFLEFQGVDSSTGGIKSGVTWTVRRCIDGTFAAGGGTVTEDGTTGWYKYAMSQGDTNGNDIGFNFTGTGAVPQTLNILTTAADPSVGTNFGLTALPTANPGAAGGLFIAGTNAPVTITGSGNALTVTSTGANGDGINVNGNGSGSGINFTPGATGHGIKTTGGATSGDAINAIAGALGHGFTVAGIGTAKHGINASGFGTGSGISGTGGGTGHGILGTSGTGVSGDGIRGVAASIDGNGLSALGNGNGDGVHTTGGAGAAGDGIEAVAGGGVPIRGNITGNLTGSVNSVTTRVTANTDQWAGATIPAPNVTGVPLVDLIYTLGTISPATPGSVRADSVTGQVTIDAPIKKNTALANFQIVMTDSTNHNPTPGLTVTVTRAIDAGGFATGTLGAVTDMGNGWYRFDFGAGDLNGTTIAVKATAPGADDLDFTIVTVP